MDTMKDSAAVLLDILGSSASPVSVHYLSQLIHIGVCPNMNFMMAADARERNYEQLLFVVNTNVDMLLVSIYLKSLVQNFTGDTADPSNPRQYTLVTFDETSLSSKYSLGRELFRCPRRLIDV